MKLFIALLINALVAAIACLLVYRRQVREMRRGINSYEEPELYLYLGIALIVAVIFFSTIIFLLK